ncbi:hypothetical protein P8452_25466 [Trifolium repens]|nr:hypothetical protein P8452_25466 [Trifolium repens]
MREDDSNWFSRWEEQLPSPDELMPLSQTQITPDLAIAFDIRNNINNNTHNTINNINHTNPQQQQQLVLMLPSTSQLTIGAINGATNNHLVFFYEPFTVTAFSDSVQIGNGSLPAFNSDKNNQTSLRSVLSNSQDLDTESLTSLRSGLKRKKGFPVVIQMDTKVKMKMEWLKSKKVGIRVTCEGIRGTVPAGKLSSVASVIDSECKVDLRIKIWKFSF